MTEPERSSATRGATRRSSGRIVVDEHDPEDADLIEFWNRMTRLHPTVRGSLPQGSGEMFQPTQGACKVISARRGDAPGALIGVNTIRVATAGRAAPPGAVFGANLLVHPSFRGGTVAGQLMDRLFRESILSGVERLLALVDPHSETAYRLYRYFGFHFLDPAVGEDPYVVLESHWPLVVRFLLDGVAADLPSWPDPAWRMLARGLPARNFNKEDRSDLTATTRHHDILEYGTTLPGWHRPSVTVLVERRSGRVVGMRGDFLELQLIPDPERGWCRVLATNHAPGVLRIVAQSRGRPLLDAALEPGCNVASQRIQADSIDAEGWEIEAFREHDVRLCHFKFPGSAPADVAPQTCRLQGGQIAVDVSPLDGTLTLSGAVDGRQLADLAWPEIGPVSPDTQRHPPLIESTIATLADGSVEISAPADLWSDRMSNLGTHVAGALPQSVRMVRTVRAISDGLEIIDAVDVPPGESVENTTFRTGWWWTATDGVFDTGSHRWAFTPHSLAEHEARSALPANALPPVGAQLPSGSLSASVHDLDLHIDWLHPDGGEVSLRCSGRTVPRIDSPVSALGAQRSELLRTVVRAEQHREASAKPTPRSGRADPELPRRSAPTDRGLSLEMQHDGSLDLRSDGHSWIHTERSAVPIGAAPWSWGGIVPVVAEGPWRWSVDGGTAPERWTATRMAAGREDSGWFTHRWVDPERSSLVEDVVTEMSVNGNEMNVLVRPAPGTHPPQWWSAGIAMVVELPGPGVIEVSSPLGPVQLPTSSDSGRIRLLGRETVRLETPSDTLTISGPARASAVAWSVDHPDTGVHCAVLMSCPVRSAARSVLEFRIRRSS